MPRNTSSIDEDVRCDRKIDVVPSQLLSEILAMELAKKMAGLPERIP